MRTAIYVRVSTSRQAQAQTIEQQLDRLRTHMQQQGEDIVSDTVFRDDGYSGATLNRPGLDRLRYAVRAGAVGRVLVTDPDRLACRFRLKAATVSDAKAASIPIASRPAFRFEGGHHSDMKPATLPL